MAFWGEVKLSMELPQRNMTQSSFIRFDCRTNEGAKDRPKVNEAGEEEKKKLIFEFLLNELSVCRHTYIAVYSFRTVAIFALTFQTFLLISLPQFINKLTDTRTHINIYLRAALYVSYVICACTETIACENNKFILIVL